MKVLVIGGYGIFGGRVVELLEDEPRLTLVVAGRSLARAEAWCAVRRGARARLLAARFDRSGDLAAQLADLRPDVVVDASGPFQAYGERPYRVIEACIVARIDYLDLADGSDFVAGVAAFDAGARAADVSVLSGVSSFPVLTAAAVRRLAVTTPALAQIETIRAGIAPSPHAVVGENVIRAIASYAGRPVEARRDGQTVRAWPFVETRRVTVAPPGTLPLRNALFSLVDVPDLRVLPTLWPETKTVWMGAAPVPEILHRTLIALAWLVRLGVLRSLSPLAPLMYLATNRLGWGAHRGGMFVAVSGRDAAGVARERSWHMVAEGDDGPLIPSMAVEALLRRALDGQRPAPGARAAVRDLELADYEALFARRRIVAGARDETRGDARDGGPGETLPLYARLLGPAWHDLPAAVRAMHEWSGTTVAQGLAAVERGRGPAARLVAALAGFPAAAAEVPVTVRFEASDCGETWTRTFGAGRFASRQFAGCGRSAALLCERFGPLTFAMALVVEDARLRLVLRHWSLFGLPLPLWLSPRADAYETEDGGRFRFHVDIAHPLTGLIVRYRGWLAPVARCGAALPPEGAACRPQPQVL